jgi:hypothetical protein
MSKGTEEIGEEPQDYQSLKNIQTEYLPSTVIEDKNKPTCSRDFEEPKASYISGDFCLNWLSFSAFTKGNPGLYPEAVDVNPLPHKSCI